jgi:hypothetical protein
MTVYRALDIIPSQTKLPEKPPTASIALHLIIENFNKRGRGRKPARERIEAMLERDYAMVKNGNCDYKLTVAYDPDPDGISLDEEIQSLLSEMFNIAESQLLHGSRYLRGRWSATVLVDQSSVQCSFFNLAKIADLGRLGLVKRRGRRPRSRPVY